MKISSTIKHKGNWSSISPWRKNTTQPCSNIIARPPKKAAQQYKSTGLKDWSGWERCCISMMFQGSRWKHGPFIISSRHESFPVRKCSLIVCNRQQISAEMRFEKQTGMHLCLMWVCLYEGGEWGGGGGGGDQTYIRSAVKVTLQNVMLLGDVCFCFSVNIFIQTLSKLQTWVTWQCVISSSSPGICHGQFNFGTNCHEATDHQIKTNVTLCSVYVMYSQIFHMLCLDACLCGVFFLSF